MLEEESVKKKPRLEYRPIPTFKPTATYKATVINKKEDSNSYVPLDGEAKPSSVTYVPTKIGLSAESLETAKKVNEDPVATNGGGDIHDIESDVKFESNDTDILKSIEKKEKDSKSSSSKRHRSGSSSKKSSRHDSKHKSSRRDSHKDSPSSHKHKSSRHKSSTSSRDKTSSSSRKHREPSEKKVRSAKEDEKAEVIVPDEPFLSSDEDDIEEQCRQIFEDYKPDESVEASQPPVKTTESDDEPHIVDKKRQAHENAANVIRPTSYMKPNHSQSALLFAQRRSDLALQKAIAERKAKEEEIAKIEAEIKEKEQVQLTPLINPLIHYRPPKRQMISPISERMAIEAARRKVMELHKSKEAQFQRQTTAQTAAKTTGRVAHAPSSLTNDIDPCKLAPPIKEQHSTKISSNIRNQYYKIMVQHCIQIYPLPADGKHHSNLLSRMINFDRSFYIFQLTKGLKVKSLLFSKSAWHHKPTSRAVFLLSTV